MTTPHPTLALTVPITADTVRPVPETEQIDMRPILLDRD